MQGNGHNDDFGFAWVMRRRLLDIESAGGNPHDLDELKSRVRQIATLLQAYHAEVAILQKSGDHTASGLQKHAAALAATAAGKVRQITDNSILLEDIRRTRLKLETKTAPSDIDRLYQLLQMQELRSAMEAQGLTPGDTLQADLLYHQALERGDDLAAMALETWPMGSPVSRHLIQQGQTQRHASADPIAAKHLQELEDFREHLESIAREALLELPEPQDDPVARMAAGEPEPPDAA